LAAPGAVGVAKSLPCAATGGQACADTFISTIGPKLYRRPLTQAFGAVGDPWELYGSRLPVGRIAQPDDIDARAAMQLGAFYAGLSIENSMLGAAHALANADRLRVVDHPSFESHPSRGAIGRHPARRLPGW